MDGERKHRRVSAQDRRRPVPLVHIRIDDDYTLHEARGLDGAGGDGRVVEDAVSLAPVGERVVRPPREVGGEAFIECGEAR